MAHWVDRLSAAVERRAGDVEELLRALVAAPSPNPPGDERAAAGVVRAYLAGAPGVVEQMLGPSPERPTLVACAGRGSPCLALAAHLDTHRVHGSWSSDPFALRADGDRLYGLGTTDNKGAVAAMAVVFRAFAECGEAPGQVVLIANADEETGGRYGIEAVRDALPARPDGVVVAEPSGIDAPWEKLYVAARGTSRFRLTLSGVETHSSLADHPGVTNAALALERLLPALRDELEPLDRVDARFDLGPTLIPVSLSAGKGWGVVPAEAAVELELRLTPGYDQAGIERLVEGAVERAGQRLGVSPRLEYAPGSLRWMSPSEIDLGNPLVTAASRAWQDVLGAPPALGCFPGGTDARLFTERGLATLSGVGPGALCRAHHPDEFVTRGELATAVRLYAAIVVRYLDQGA